MSRQFVWFKQHCSQYIFNIRGITLIETAVVCLLLGILLSLCIPTIRESLYENPLRQDGREIARKISTFRNLAKRAQQSYTVYIDRDKRQLLFEPDDKEKTLKDKNNKAGREKLVLDQTVTIKKIWTASQGHITDNRVELWINQQGYMEKTLILLQTSQKQQIVLLFETFDSTAELHDNWATFNL